MKRKIRILIWLIIFFIGGAASLFYIQGWRVDPETGEIIPTGVIDISTDPESGTLIFINGEMKGESPLVLRGFPLGAIDVKIIRSNYEAIEARLFVEMEYVTKIKKIQLVPLEPAEDMKMIGTDDDLIIDKDLQGFVKILSGMKAIEIFDFMADEVAVYEFDEEPVSIEFLGEGEVSVRFQEGNPWNKKVFSSSMFSSRESEIAESVISPEGGHLVFARGRYLYSKNLKDETIEELLVEDVPIVGVWWMPESDDILVVTKAGVFFWNVLFQEKRNYINMDNIDTAYFFPQGKSLILHENGNWMSLVIGGGE